MINKLQKLINKITMKIQNCNLYIKKMAREPNKNHGACKLRFPLKKHQMTNLDKVINDKPYLMTELIVTDNIFS